MIERSLRRIAELSITHHPFRRVGRPPVMQTHDVPHGLTTQPISPLCDYLRSERKDSLCRHTCGRDLQKIPGLKRGQQSVKKKTTAQRQRCRSYHSREYRVARGVAPPKVQRIGVRRKAALILIGCNFGVR
jgi:hypothetical protein